MQNKFFMNFSAEGAPNFYRALLIQDPRSKKELLMTSFGILNNLRIHLNI